jgi:hypothetical protein
MSGVTVSAPGRNAGRRGLVIVMMRRTGLDDLDGEPFLFRATDTYMHHHLLVV